MTAYWSTQVTKKKTERLHLHVSVKWRTALQKNEALSLGEPDFERQWVWQMAVLLYDILVELTGYRPKVGCVNRGYVPLNCCEN